MRAAHPSLCLRPRNPRRSSEILAIEIHDCRPIRTRGESPSSSVYETHVRRTISGTNRKHRCRECNALSTRVSAIDRRRRGRGRGTDGEGEKYRRGKREKNHSRRATPRRETVLSAHSISILVRVCTPSREHGDLPFSSKLFHREERCVDSARIDHDRRFRPSFVMRPPRSMPFFSFSFFFFFKSAANDDDPTGGEAPARQVRRALARRVRITLLY